MPVLRHSSLRSSMATRGLAAWQRLAGTGHSPARNRPSWSTTASSWSLPWSGSTAGGRQCASPLAALPRSPRPAGSAAGRSVACCRSSRTRLTTKGVLQVRLVRGHLLLRCCRGVLGTLQVRLVHVRGAAGVLRRCCGPLGLGHGVLGTQQVRLVLGRLLFRCCRGVLGAAGTPCARPGERRRRPSRRPCRCSSAPGPARRQVPPGAKLGNYKGLSNVCELQRPPPTLTARTHTHPATQHPSACG